MILNLQTVFIELHGNPSMKKVVLPGMTITELLTTIAILGMVTIAALPSYGGIQGRQALKSAQQGIQSMLYRMQELAIAPTQLSESSQNTTVGYGLYFFRQSNIPGANYPKINGCEVRTTSDFVVLYRFVRPQNSSLSIAAEPNFLSSGQQGCPLGFVSPDRETSNFYVLPRSVVLSDQSSHAFPWLVTQPIGAVGNSVGNLATVSPYTDPLNSAQGKARLVLEHKSLKIGANRKALTRVVEFQKHTNGITANQGLAL